MLFYKKGKLGKVTEDWRNQVTDLNQMPRIISADVNIEEGNSRNVNNKNLNCTDTSHQDKGLINFTNISRKGQEGSYCHLKRYCHVCRVADRGVHEFKMCANCQSVYFCTKSCQLKLLK